MKNIRKLLSIVLAADIAISQHFLCYSADGSLGISDENSQSKIEYLNTLEMSDEDSDSDLDAADADLEDDDITIGEDIDSEEDETSEIGTSSGEIEESGKEESPKSESKKDLKSDEDSDLPFNLQGLPDDYDLSLQQVQQRQSAIFNNVSGTVSSLTAGEDYVEDELVVIAYTKEDAELAAAAYNGNLKSYENNVAVITIDPDELTVQSAMELVENLDYNLPPASPNYITYFDPTTEISSDELRLSVDNAIELQSIPVGQTWETSNYNDEFLEPSNSYYQWFHDAIDSYAAWANIPDGSCDDTGITVAIIDSGVSNTHPELNVTHVKYTSDIGTSDFYGHGTHVAGLVGAKLNNEIGGAGVAPGVQIKSYRVGSSSGVIKLSHITRAFEAVAGNGSRQADIINISIGIYGYNAALATAVADAYNAGVTIVTSLGNDSCESVQYPAAFDNVIAVAATNIKGVKADFSNYGSNCDIAAPGDKIPSTYYNPSTGKDTYLIESGTSMASPIVAGACALYMSVAGYTDPDTMLEVLQNSASASSSSNIGAGILCLSGMFSVDTTAPSITVQNDDEVITDFSSAIPYTSTVTLTDASVYGNGTVVFSLNGSNPAISGGEVTNGYEYTEPIVISKYIEDGTVSVGSKITLKAATVNNMGTLSNVSSITFTVDYCAPSSLTISTEGNVTTIPGGNSLQLYSEVLPENTCTDVTWSIDWDQTELSEDEVSVSDSGLLKTVKGSEGDVTVVCTSAYDTNISQSIVITVEQAIKKVKSLKLNKSTTVLGYLSDDNPIEMQLNVLSIINVDNESQDASDYNYQWTSSNTSIVQVSANGSDTAIITGCKKGRAKITCLVLDGSGKKATCVVTVKQLLTDITVTGQDNIAIGAKATFKKSVLPSTANNKNVVWSLETDISGCSVNSKTGQVKVDKTATTGTITVIATASDGGGTVGKKTVNIIDEKAKSVTITTQESKTDINQLIYNSRNSLIKMRLYTVDVSTSDDDEHTIQLEGTVSNGTEPQWVSSNTKVATVDDTGLVTAVSKGNVTISCKALDGSGKKTSVKIKVIVPVSHISVTTTNSKTYLNYGKSITAKRVFTTTYGNPSVTGVTWTAELVGVYIDSSGNYTYDEAGNSVINEEALNSKYIKISKNGKLSVSKKLLLASYNGNYASYLQELGNNAFLAVKVTATSTDGTEVSGSEYIKLLNY